MNIRRHLSYANVGVTVCLFLILAGGIAYATGKIGSHEIKNNSIKSVDLKNRKAVRGKDVVRNSLRGSQIAEKTLNAGAFAPVAWNSPTICGSLKVYAWPQKSQWTLASPSPSRAAARLSSRPSERKVSSTRSREQEQANCSGRRPSSRTPSSWNSR